MEAKKEKSCADLVQRRWEGRRDELEKYEANGWERFHEYGLSFDYVEPNTFEGQTRGYHRFQLSWGGPSDEIRFYTTVAEHDNHLLDRAEYWYMDWFDGAKVDADDDIILDICNMFLEVSNVHG